MVLFTTQRRDLKKLDRIDRKIMRLLQENGRITNSALAEAVGLSPPPCLRRVRMLEKRGFINGYHANLNMTKLGYPVVVYCYVVLKSRTESLVAAFEERVRSWPIVQEAHLLQGEMDFLLRVVAKDVDTFQNFFTNELMAAENVETIKTSIKVRTAKHNHEAQPII